MHLIPLPLEPALAALTRHLRPNERDAKGLLKAITRSGYRIPAEIAGTNTLRISGVLYIVLDRNLVAARAWSGVTYERA